MDLLIKSSAILLLGSLVSLLIRKSNPELALLLNLASVTLVFILAFSVAEEIKSTMESVNRMTDNAAVMTYPVLKCLAVAAITRLCSELCRDASQGAASSAIELMGTICALSVSLPLIMSVVKTIGGLL